MEFDVETQYSRVIVGQTLTEANIGWLEERNFISGFTARQERQ